MKTTELILGIDLGGATRNAMCLMGSDLKIQRCSYISYIDSKNKLDHRLRIISDINSYISDFGSDISIVFERINLYRGGAISHLYNIISLCRVQTTIINEFSDICPIYDIAVKSWKARALGNGNANKDDSINEVKRLYPEVDLNVTIKHKRKDDEIVLNHDLADSILIAKACCENPDLLDDKNKLNFS